MPSKKKQFKQKQKQKQSQNVTVNVITNKSIKKTVAQPTTVAPYTPYIIPHSYTSLNSLRPNIDTTYNAYQHLATNAPYKNPVKKETLNNDVSKGVSLKPLLGSNSVPTIIYEDDDYNRLYVPRQNDKLLKEEDNLQNLREEIKEANKRALEPELRPLSEAPLSEAPLSETPLKAPLSEAPLSEELGELYRANQNEDRILKREKVESLVEEKKKAVKRDILNDIRRRYVEDRLQQYTDNDEYFLTQLNRLPDIPTTRRTETEYTGIVRQPPLPSISEEQRELYRASIASKKRWNESDIPVAVAVDTTPIPVPPPLKPVKAITPKYYKSLEQLQDEALLKGVPILKEQNGKTKRYTRDELIEMLKNK